MSDNQGGVRISAAVGWLLGQLLERPLDPEDAVVLGRTLVAAGEALLRRSEDTTGDPSGA
ncbi:MAG TPA: hypothetical protein VHV49_11120 [Pseudonocardiaceae bacterium]|jgi:hypothetical protein|nr:hypothetical protein [Pseudonocardiaceae bacterium]